MHIYREGSNVTALAPLLRALSSSLLHTSSLCMYVVRTITLRVTHLRLVYSVLRVIRAVPLYEKKYGLFSILFLG